MEIKIEDLLSKCEDCNGTGQREKKDGNYSQTWRCEKCKGSGKVMTESGKALGEFLDFLREHPGQLKYFR
jgi:DnaJ-class molecular chaperone